MERSKFGVRIPLTAAVLCLLGYYGGYVITGLLVGYILLKEESIFLKKLSVKVVLTMLVFSLISTVLYLVPNILDTVETLIRVFNEEYYMNSGIYRFVNFPSSLLSLLKTVVFLLMGFNALRGKETTVPLVDQIIKKYL